MWEKMKFLASSLWTFFRPLVRQFLKEIGPFLATAATLAVQRAATKAISSTEKKEFAQKEIILELQSLGFKLGADFTTRMVNAAIEAAVAGLDD